MLIMFHLFNQNLLFFIPIFILAVSANQPSKSDNMCNSTKSVLCVQDALMMITFEARRISRIANEMEKHILNRTGAVDTLYRYVNFEMNEIHSQLPTLQYHAQFFRLDNIDQKYLNNLLLEAHYAMSFYYNSIGDILNMKDVFPSTVKSWFRQIESNLKKEMICRYRSILDVYSLEWPAINQINRIQFSHKKYRTATSLIHNTHSIIIVRLLHEWMQKIDLLLINLDTKFF